MHIYIYIYIHRPKATSALRPSLAGADDRHEGEMRWLKWQNGKREALVIERA